MMGLPRMTIDFGFAIAGQKMKRGFSTRFKKLHFSNFPLPGKIKVCRCLFPFGIEAHAQFKFLMRET